MISYEWAIRLKRTAREYVWFLLTWGLNSHIKKKSKNGTICGTETAKLTGCFVSRAHSKYIWSFYRHNKNRYMKKRQRRPGPETEKNDILYTAKYTKPPAHMHESPILIVTLHAALENGSTVPAGWSWFWSFASQYFKFLSCINCILFKFEGSFPGDAVRCFPQVFPSQNAERDGCASSE